MTNVLRTAWIESTWRWFNPFWKFHAVGYNAAKKKVTKSFLVLNRNKWKKILYIKWAVLFAWNLSIFKIPLGEYRRNWCLGLPMGRRTGGRRCTFHRSPFIHFVPWVFIFKNKLIKKWKRASGHFSGLLGEVPLGEDTVCPSKARRLRS